DFQALFYSRLIGGIITDGAESDSFDPAPVLVGGGAGADVHEDFLFGERRSSVAFSCAACIAVFMFKLGLRQSYAAQYVRRFSWAGIAKVLPLLNCWSSSRSSVF
ncbi:MAG: hypothetical protein II486_00645, partial [Thermoguttaceae bacterium]|nr:hypothetical protein [Thermoguttaceae bacterium]